MFKTIAMTCGTMLCLFPDGMTAQGNTGADGSSAACHRGEFEVLRPFLGEWRVEATDRISPGNFERTSGTSSITSVMDGCVLLEQYRGGRQQVDFQRMTILSITPDGAFERLHLDTGHGAFTVSRGHRTGDTLAFEYARAFPERTLRTWALYTEVTADRFRLTRYLRRSAGEERELTFDAVYERVR